MVMPHSLPLTIDEADALGTAIRLRAAREGVSEEDMVIGILRKALAPEIEEATGRLPLTAVIQQVMQASPKGA
jgi:plasmid stability protein